MRPPRLRTFDYTGYHAYSLTFATFARQPRFTDPAIVALVLREILRTADSAEFDVLAYCFMPDHLHLLVAGRSLTARLPAFAKAARQRCAVAFSRSRGVRLWQSGYLEHTLRGSEAVDVVAQYIEANPVRAGLAKSVSEWPFTGGSLLRAPTGDRPNAAPNS